LGKPIRAWDALDRMGINTSTWRASELADLVALTETRGRAVDAVRIEDEVVRRVSAAAAAECW
jgi:hypothetical protein